MNRIRHVGLASCCALAAACVSISEQAKMRLEDPVQCDMAADEIAALESERASAGWRVVSGVMGAAPPSVVISLVRDVAGKPRGIYLDHWRVAFGSYNRKLDAKIAEIRETCGV